MSRSPQVAESRYREDHTHEKACICCQADADFLNRPFACVEIDDPSTWHVTSAGCDMYSMTLSCLYGKPRSSDDPLMSFTVAALRHVMMHISRNIMHVYHDAARHPSATISEVFQQGDARPLLSDTVRDGPVSVPLAPGMSVTIRDSRHSRSSNGHPTTTRSPRPACTGGSCICICRIFAACVVENDSTGTA
nr:hypothetical protein CFP56_04001 [Quercus suber]